MQQDVVYECRVFLDNIDKYAMAFMLLTNSVTRFFEGHPIEVLDEGRCYCRMCS